MLSLFFGVIKVSHINPKLVIFYGSAVTLVVVLFHGVTRYGEAQLQAAPNINGRYLSAQAMPGCPENSRVMMSVLQSGVFLNGAIEVVESAQAASKATPLSGEWRQRRLSLNGEQSLCNKAGQVAIEGTVTGAGEKAVFTGTVAIGGQIWQLTGQRLAEPKQETGH
jgi:hypothetical protein